MTDWSCVKMHYWDALCFPDLVGKINHVSAEENGFHSENIFHSCHLWNWFWLKINIEFISPCVPTLELIQRWIISELFTETMFFEQGEPSFLFALLPSCLSASLLLFILMLIFNLICIQITSQVVHQYEVRMLATEKHLLILLPPSSPSSFSPPRCVPISSPLSFCLFQHFLCLQHITVHRCVWSRKRR